MSRPTTELDNVTSLTDLADVTEPTGETDVTEPAGEADVTEPTGEADEPSDDTETGRSRRGRWWLVAGGLAVAALGLAAVIGRTMTCDGGFVDCARAGYIKHIESRLVEPELHDEAWPGLQHDAVPAADADHRSGSNSGSDAVGAATPEVSRFDFFGIQYVPESDYGTVGDLGADAVLIDFAHDGSPEEWTAQLDTANASGLRVVAWLWPNGWTWDEAADRWSISDQAVRFLGTVADHPALLAVYGTHEAYWNDCFDCGYTTAQLQQLYQQIKTIEDVPIYSAFSGFTFWQEMGSSTTFADGVCDYCDTWYYPVLADGEFDRDEYIKRLDDEITTFRQLAPNSKLVWVLQSFGSTQWERSLPSPEQLAEMAELAATADLDGVWWYPWTFDTETYEDVLSENPQLHPVIAESAGLFGRTAGDTGDGVTGADG